jgi:hypothetical protein
MTEHLCPPSTNAWNDLPCAAACQAAATDPGGAGGICLRFANVEVPGPFLTGRVGRVRRGCPNYH